ncbi:MAG: substrate-binding domain-containing protein [Bacteroidia bacterium]
MTTFKIAGVPEHFNYPWHFAKEQGYFTKAGLDIDWQDNKSGTGAIVKLLNTGEIDMAVLLTEGIIADISKGGNSKIIQVFVKSSLNWGIHVAVHSIIQHKFGIKGKRFAISRLGSGSHIMAYVLAEQLGYKPSPEDFVIVNDMDGAQNALTNNEADVFLWEKYMTMPLVESGHFKRVGEIPTPWPGFVIAARNEICETREKELKRLLKVIRTASGDFMSHPDSFELIAKRYGLKIDKMYEWFQITEWETKENIPADMIYLTTQTLQNVGIINELKLPQTFCADWCNLV